MRSGIYLIKLIVLAISLASVSAHAESETSARRRGGCDSDYECGSEDYEQPSRRPEAAPVQPAGKPTMGECGQLPLRYGARSLGASCGSGSVGGSRFPERVAADTRDMWDRYLTAGLPEQAQEVRLNDKIGWSGTKAIPVTEDWSWIEYVGDYSNPSYCHPNQPQEYLETTCTIPREEVYYRDEEDTSNCISWKEDDPPPSTSGSSSFGSPSGSRGSGSGSSGRSSSPSINTGPSRGGGESRGSMRDDYGSTMDVPSRENFFRGPAGRTCLEYGTHRVRHTRPADPITYSCVKPFNRYCVYPVTRQERRACKDVPVRFDIRYVHFPKGRPGVNEWKPGYKDPKFPYRNYNNLLPNRFDLLLGEDERVNMTINKDGESTKVTPALSIQSLWNEYDYSVDPSSRLTCGAGAQPYIKINIHTIGRIKRKMPNALVVPTVMRNGKPESVAFTYEQEVLKNGKRADGRPATLTLNDNSRGLMLDASLQSRIYGRSEKTGNHLEAGTPTDKVGTAANGGFWVDTQYRMQLFKKDKWGRDIRITRPTVANQNQVQYNNDAVSIDLLGKNAVKDFYKMSSSGIFEPIMGRIYNVFSIALTPGDTYYVKVWMVTRGLPWYDAGCRGSKSDCQGEEASTKSYSEPVVIQFKASKEVDHRGLLQKLFDFQEWLAPF